MTNFPSNVVIQEGDDVYMDCSTDAVNNSITWSYDADPVVTAHCTARDTSRFNVSDRSTNVCNIIGYANPVLGNQGPYHCSDGTGATAEAVAILIGIRDFYQSINPSFYPLENEPRKSK